MNRFLIIISLLCGAFALLSAIWILVPAPSYYIWLYSVAVSEWSLWVGAIALVGIILALLDYAFYKNGVAATILIIIGIIAFLISLYPFLTAWQIAREKNLSLSFGQYFNGLKSEKPITQFKTYSFKSGESSELKMDVYTPPENVESNGAGVIVIHGGSWSGGTRNDFPQWNNWLADNGFTVFDIDYTLAQPNYKTAVGDVKCAIRQIKKRSVDFHILPDKIFLLGRSAGGHLALLAAYSANDEKLPASCVEEEDADERVHGVVAFYAPTDLLWSYDNPANQSVIDGPQTLANFLGGHPHESEIRARFILDSPTERVNLNTPPTLLIHGEHDQLVRKENLDRLAEKLKQNNIAYETLVINYAQHGFDYNFNGWGSQISKPLILDFLNANTK